VVSNFTVIIFEWVLLSVWTTLCWSQKWHNYFWFSRNNQQDATS